MLFLLFNFSSDENEADLSQSRKHTPTPSSDFGSFPNVSQRTMDPSEMLQQLLSEPANKLVWERVCILKANKL